MSASNGRTLDDYRNKPQRKTGQCFNCGARPTEARVIISLQARTVIPGRGPKDANAITWPVVASRSASFCEACGIPVFEAVIGSVTDP